MSTIAITMFLLFAFALVSKAARWNASSSDLRMLLRAAQIPFADRIGSSVLPAALVIDASVCVALAADERLGLWLAGGSATIFAWVLARAPKSTTCACFGFFHSTSRESMIRDFAIACTSFIVLLTSALDATSKSDIIQASILALMFLFAPALPRAQMRLAQSGQMPTHAKTARRGRERRIGGNWR